LLLVSWALSTVTFAIQFARFTLRRYEDRLEVSWGVIKRNHVTVRLHRVQALVVHQGLLRQPFGLCTMLVEVAGGGTKEKERVSLLHPLIRKRELEEFLRDILPEYRMPKVMTPLPKRSQRRYLFRALAPVTALVAIMISASHLWEVPYAWSSLLLLVLAALLGRSRHADAMTSLDGGQLTLRFRNVSLHHVLIGRSHVQSLTLSANPFQRLGRLRTVSISLLSSPARKSFWVKDVEGAEAQAIRDWYSRTGPY
jgi:putative membrane protein